MIRISEKKRFALIPILVGSMVISTFLILPLLHDLQGLLNFYLPILNETTPILYLDDGKLEFEGNIPQHITLANGVVVFFDSTANDSLLQQSPPGSVFISTTEIVLRKKTGIKEIFLDSVKIENGPLVIHPMKVKAKLLKFRNLLFTVIGIGCVLGVFLSLFFITSFAAGIGLMIDAFMNGPHTFGKLLNWASFIILFFILLWIVAGLRSFTVFVVLLILYFTIIATFVYLSVKLRYGKNLQSSQNPKI